MASFKCKDIGMKCGFEVKDENEDEMMKIIGMHAQETHKLDPTTPEMQARVKKAVKK